MRSSTYIAVLSTLLAAAVAAPVKRDIETNTVTEIDIVTELVTQVVWVDPTGGPVIVGPAHTAPAVTTTVEAPAPSSTSSQVYVAPPAPTTTSSTQAAPTSSSSVYVAPPAPTTSSTSLYVAPVQTAPPQPAAPEPTTTSTYVPPAPTTTSTSTSQYVAPSPAWTPPATTTTAAAVQSPAAQTTSSSSYSGDLTYYDVGLGSCGNTNTDSEMVLAMAVGVMNKATMCGKTITISYGGSTHQGTIVDTCMGCADGSIDVSPALFKAVAPNGDGRVHDVQWWFN